MASQGAGEANDRAPFNEPATPQDAGAAPTRRAVRLLVESATRGGQVPGFGCKRSDSRKLAYSRV
jgi:hypothetical protein